MSLIARVLHSWIANPLVAYLTNPDTAKEIWQPLNHGRGPLFEAWREND